MRNRPGFCKMLDDIKTGRLVVDLILVDTLERFGRMDEVSTLRRHLLNHFGVMIVTGDSGFTDPTGVAGQALGVVESIRATTVAHARANDVRRGKVDAAKLGHWPGGPAPTGLKLKSVMKPKTDPAEVDYRIAVPNPAEVPAVQKYFELADVHGWGGSRIAGFLNADEDFVAKYGKVAASTVDYVLSNPIYVGVLRFNVNTTLIVDDRRVTRPNDKADVIYVKDFCEPIIDWDRWDRVQKIRTHRSARMKAVRARNRKPNGKHIQPVAPGVVLKNALSGLVRCPTCKCAMRPNRSGGEQYFYYGCPRYWDGRCSNGRKVRGDWLWERFVALVRERLFPLSGSDSGEVPRWVEELMAEVCTELGQLHAQKQNHRPLLERECAGLENQIAGWSQTLSNNELTQVVRRRIEVDFNRAVVRQQQLEAELAGLDNEAHRAKEMLRADAAIERLHRLHDILADTNPTAINLELARHVEAIFIHSDGRVVVRAQRLGIFEGLTETLALPAGRAESCTEAEARSAEKPAVQPRKALLKRGSADFQLTGTATAVSSAPSLLAVKLPDKWMHEEVVTMPRRHTWAHIHAQEVLQKRAETNWSQRRLAEFFDVSAPTIRHAIKIANGSGESV